MDPCESSSRGRSKGTKLCIKSGGIYISNKHSNKTIRIPDTAFGTTQFSSPRACIGPCTRPICGPQNAEILSFHCTVHLIFLIRRGLGYGLASHITVLPICLVSYPMGATKVRYQRGEHQPWSRHLCMQHPAEGLPPRLAGCPL